ncbi:hypothetical protein AOQ84DRAFT_351269 [Glonium stellatum]|uniref:Uncharacterized protein n=1 Tax=Glonium stellatum TaxID=574774 RepID=A0A8E2FDH9_9PEZI|nr:hypothetical protein AOQ84DRAFT_351269 [Glonium stellatum]
MVGIITALMPSLLTLHLSFSAFAYFSLSAFPFYRKRSWSERKYGTAPVDHQLQQA